MPAFFAVCLFYVFVSFIQFLFLSNSWSTCEVHANPLGLRGAQAGNRCSIGTHAPETILVINLGVLVLSRKRNNRHFTWIHWRSKWGCGGGGLPRETHLFFFFTMGNTFVSFSGRGGTWHFFKSFGQRLAYNSVSAPVGKSSWYTTAWTVFHKSDKKCSTSTGCKKNITIV